MLGWQHQFLKEIPDFFRASTVITGSPQTRFSSSCHVIRERTAFGTTFCKPSRIALIYRPVTKLKINGYGN